MSLLEPVRVYVAVCAQDYTLSCLFSAVTNRFCAMDHTLREELAIDIPLRRLGQCLAASWVVRTLPKSVDQHYRQRGLPDPIGAHLHPFVLKVVVDGREVTVGITDCEMSPVNKKRKERKLTGQHVYVQGSATRVATMMVAVKETLHAEFPGILVPTPSKEELWARPKGCRDIILDDLDPEKDTLVGVQLEPPHRLQTITKVDKWTRYAFGEPNRTWWCNASDDHDFFFEDEAAIKGWRRYTQPGTERPWLFKEGTGD